MKCPQCGHIFSGAEPPPKATPEVMAIFNHWNAQKIKVHRVLDEKKNKAIMAALKKWSHAEIIAAISRYGRWMNEYGLGNRTWGYPWTLKEFLTRENAMEAKFMDDDIFEQFKPYVAPPKNQPESRHYPIFG